MHNGATKRRTGALIVGVRIQPPAAPCDYKTAQLIVEVNARKVAFRVVESEHPSLKDGISEEHYCSCACGREGSC